MVIGARRKRRRWLEELGRLVPGALVVLFLSGSVASVIALFLVVTIPMVVLVVVALALLVLPSRLKREH